MNFAEEKMYQRFKYFVIALGLHVTVFTTLFIYDLFFRPKPKPQAQIIMIGTNLPKGDPNAPTHLRPGTAGGSVGKTNNTSEKQASQKQEKTPVAQTKTQKTEPKTKEAKKTPTQKSSTQSNEKKQEKTAKKTKLQEPKKNQQKAEPKKQSAQNNNTQTKNNKAQDSTKQAKDSSTQNSAQDSATPTKTADPQAQAREDARMAALGDIQNQIDARSNTGAPSASSSGGNGSASSGNGAGGGGAGSPNGSGHANYAGYQAIIKSKIMSNWRPHSTRDENGKKLSTQILIRIDAAGNLIAKSVRRSSQNASFDNAALRAVQAASPFAAPPPEIAPGLLKGGISITF